MNIAIVGATGLVGRTMLKVIEEQEVAFSSIRLFASKRSAGETIEFLGRGLRVEELTEESFKGIDVALFSAGSSISKTYAPMAAAIGCIVIDNSSAWRMDPDVPLVVPEVNPDDVKTHQGIIANPNCSTIQLVVALKPLHDVFTIKRAVVSTYQSPSGAGQSGVNQLLAEERGETVEQKIAPHPIAHNTVFHSSTAGEEFTEEEQKMMRETLRILHESSLPIAVTCVRVPVLGGHGESVAVEFKQPITIERVKRELENAPGVVVCDDVERGIYPTTQMAGGRDEVFVGRIRRDPSVENGVLMWVVADNLRKGAATNAVQILQLLQNVERSIA